MPQLVWPTHKVYKISATAHYALHTRKQRLLIGCCSAETMTGPFFATSTNHRLAHSMTWPAVAVASVRHHTSVQWSPLAKSYLSAGSWYYTAHQLQPDGVCGPDLR